MKFLKWLLYIIIILLFGFLFMKFGELNHQIVSVNLGKRILEMDLAKLIMVAMGIGLVIGLLFLTLNLVFGLFKDTKKMRSDNRNRKYRHLLKDFRDFFWRKDYSEAQSANIKALKIKSEAPEALLNSAEMYLNSGDTKMGIQILEKIHRLVPEDLETVNKLLQIYNENKYFGEALQLAKDVQEQQKDNLGIIFSLRDIYINLGDWDKARELQEDIIKRIRKLSKNSVQYFDIKKEEHKLSLIKYELGLKNAGLSNDSEAVRYLTESISGYPEFLPGYYKLGDLYKTMGETKKATDILKTGLSKKISYPLCRKLEDIYITEGKPNDAIKFFTELFNKNSENEVLVIYLSRLFLRLEMPDRAKEYIDKLSVMNKDSLYLQKLLSFYNIQELPNFKSELKESLRKQLLKSEYICSVCGFTVDKFIAVCPNCKKDNVFELKIQKNS